MIRVMTNDRTQGQTIEHENFFGSCNSSYSTTSVTLCKNVIRLQ